MISPESSSLYRRARETDDPLVADLYRRSARAAAVHARGGCDGGTCTATRSCALRLTSVMGHIADLMGHDAWAETFADVT